MMFVLAKVLLICGYRGDKVAGGECELIAMKQVDCREFEWYISEDVRHGVNG